MANRYQKGEAGVDGYLSRPMAQGAWPAVIMLHESWSLEEQFRDLGRRVAQEDIVTLVADLLTSMSEIDRLKNSLERRQKPSELL